MDYLDAVEVIKHPLKYGPVDRGKAAELAVQALEHMEEYRWHDLREDSEDLPPIAEPVQAVASYRNYWFENITAVRYRDGWCYNMIDCLRGLEDDATILKWKRIDRAKEEK